MSVLKNTRVVIGLCLAGGISAAVVIGWPTGFFARIADFVAGLWNGLVAWLSSPLGWDHLLAGAGVLLAPVIMLVIILALTDN
ncbi:hypothetical protein [Streptomyces sp. NPDC052042]|uniref:hypothetical protein n=1 Tax=Streptomyces sp. NPDC052042 TaxID=3365683 RepID=UPI0037D437FA